MTPAVMSMADAARILHRSPRSTLRWLQARVHIEPNVLERGEGERVWSVRREPFMRLTDATDADLRADVKKVVEDVRDLDRRVRYLEAGVTVTDGHGRSRTVTDGHGRSI